MNFTISILCYNYGRYLGAAIDSALSQHLAEGDTLEVLVVDDGSTDETPQVCARYGERIRVLRSANQGFGPSLSKAVREARGDFVCLMDADDHFAPGKLDALRPHLAAGALYVDHAQWKMDAEGTVLPGVHHGGNTSTICVHRASALPLLPIENEVALQTLWRAGRGVRLAQALGYYRLHEHSMTDRSRAGVQNDYLAGVHHRLAQQLRGLAPLPAWLADRRVLMGIVHEYESMGHYCDLEAALERGQPLRAYAACARMVAASLRSRPGFTIFTAKMIAKTLLMRPSFPKARAA